MQKLVAIAVGVIVAIGIVVYFARSSEKTSAAASEVEQSRQQSAKSPLVAASEPEQPQSPPSDGAGTNAATPQAATGQFSTSPSRAGLKVATQSASHREMRAACDEMFQRQQEREQRARDAEPKDPVWAYAMEQKLREYTSRRFQSTAIAVSKIECKTTFCEISADALVPEAADEFNKAIAALREEPWSKFTGTSITNSNDSGKQVQFARVSLRGSSAAAGPTPEEKKMWMACAAALNEENDRKRAAMDAEPRDTSWADPMEQLLRQYIVEHTAQHPADKLEITCRTSFCEITATGRTEEFALAFQKAAQEVAMEPWSGLRNGESGGGTLPDLSGMQMHQVLHRTD
jgi:hypothetical protein